MNEFEQRILNLEREVRALKTAHRRGLAVIDFGTSQIEALQSSSFGFYVRMTGSNRRTFPFLVQIAKPDVYIGRNTINPIVIDEENNTITVHFYPFEASTPGSQHPEIKLVATDSIEVYGDLEPIYGE